jgi:hypothetical protein
VPVLTGVGAVVNTAQVRAGASVAVIGLGGVGLASLLGARAAVPARSSPSTYRMRNSIGEVAWRHAHLQCGQCGCQEQIRELTSGGVEYAFELAGSVRALELAYKITRRGGTTVTAGLPPPTATFALPAVNLVAEERTLKGSYIGTCVPSRDIPRYIELYRQGRLPIDRLMSGKLELETSIAASTCCMKARRCGKSSCFDRRPRRSWTDGITWPINLQTGWIRRVSCTSSGADQQQSLFRSMAGNAGLFGIGGVNAALRRSTPPSTRRPTQPSRCAKRRPCGNRRCNSGSTLPRKRCRRRVSPANR